MPAHRRVLVLLVVSLLCGLFATGCEDLVQDPSFHTWCGEELCAWKLESGKIRKAPTWHKKDFGVELLDPAPGQTTALSQVTTLAPRCLEFATIADVAPGAQVTIGLDFNDDGTVDHEQPIAATGFREQKTQVSAPLEYAGLRFIITKKGRGRAVLAQMQVTGSAECTAAPLALRDLPLGTPCSLVNGGDECSSGVCCEGLCSDCCGGDSPLGERLPNDGGILPNEIIACPAGGACASRVQGIRGGLGGWKLSVPRQCEGGEGKKPSASECLRSDDCASGECEGAVWNVPSYAGDSVDGQCPAPFPYEGCNVIGVRGGTCK